MSTDDSITLLTLGATLTISLLSMAGSTIAFCLGKRAREQLVEKISLAKVLGDERTAARKAKAQLEHYKQPLLKAAFALQSRLWNILYDDFFVSAQASHDPRDKRYAIDHTLYLIAQWFCWNQIVSRTVRVLRLEDVDSDSMKARLRQPHGLFGRRASNNETREDKTSKLTGLLAQASHAFRSSVIGWDGSVGIWTGEQEAIGDLLTKELQSSLSFEGHRSLDCMGFGEFAEKLKGDPSWRQWLIPVRAELGALMSQGSIEPARKRLEQVQKSLVDLVILLDPHQQMRDGAKARRHSTDAARAAYLLNPPTPGTPHDDKKGRRGLSNVGWWNHVPDWNTGNEQQSGLKRRSRGSSGRRNT